MSSLREETTLTGGVADSVDLTIVTGVLETTLSFDTVSLENLINRVSLVRVFRISIAI